MLEDAGELSRLDEEMYGPNVREALDRIYIERVAKEKEELSERAILEEQEKPIEVPEHPASDQAVQFQTLPVPSKSPKKTRSVYNDRLMIQDSLIVIACLLSRASVNLRNELAVKKPKKKSRGLKMGEDTEWVIIEKYIEEAEAHMGSLKLEEQKGRRRDHGCV